MAKAVGHAPSTIHRIWRAFGLQPHRAETFKLSTDPLFVEKVRDIVGLYFAARTRRGPVRRREEPFRRSTERSRCCRCAQARPSGRRMTTRVTEHLAVCGARRATGTVVGKCFARHRAREFRAFLDVVEPTFPPISTSTSSWTTTPPTRPSHPRLVRQAAALALHYTPTSASWINQVERFFALLTEEPSARRASLDCRIRSSHPGLHQRH